MLLVGLTGAIGSGKSTVAAAFAGRGAAVVDADELARLVLEPGSPAHEEVVERFGPGVVGPGRSIDRAALARIVFFDPEALADLDSITHPRIGAAIEERVAALRGAGAPGAPGAPEVVVLDVPLLDASWKARLGLDLVVVVDTPEEVALERLVRSRGLDEADARARRAAQLRPEERLALADVVVHNAGSRADLAEEVARAWEEIAARL